MNENHAKLCPSPEWAEWLQGEVLPEVTKGIELGGELLEVGPGPGAATGWLRHRVSRLVALETDEAAAAKLAARLDGANVEVVTGDATQMTFADGSFDSVASFTMLHHIPTAALQNRLLAEVLRVLRPGGVLFGSDSLASDGLHHFHVDDTYNPVEPAAFLTRLQTIGFGKITISVDHGISFVAHKPAPEAQ
ncbi:MAG TPA: class I SAM-dependent methyltransferase [Streptosporangiaceae bacterium]|nr:class I SAM-dependent methyltransferase [Streptosporangiaceae bacterium]